MVPDFLKGSFQGKGTGSIKKKSKTTTVSLSPGVTKYSQFIRPLVSGAKRKLQRISDDEVTLTLGCRHFIEI